MVSKCRSCCFCSTENLLKQKLFQNNCFTKSTSLTASMKISLWCIRLFIILCKTLAFYHKIMAFSWWTFRYTPCKLFKSLTDLITQFPEFLCLCWTWICGPPQRTWQIVTARPEVHNNKGAKCGAFMRDGRFYFIGGCYIRVYEDIRNCPWRRIPKKIVPNTCQPT